MPKLIYCIHALSLFLHKLGKAPLIMDLVGTAQFSGGIHLLILPDNNEGFVRHFIAEIRHKVLNNFNKVFQVCNGLSEKYC